MNISMNFICVGLGRNSACYPIFFLICNPARSFWLVGCLSFKSSCDVYLGHRGRTLEKVPPSYLKNF